MNAYYALIDQYEAGGGTLAAAVRGLSREQMLWAPPDDAPASVGRWSIQQVVIHTMDSDLVSADRLKRMIAEDDPPLIGYDESRFARSLFYEQQSADDAITILDLNRRNFARALRKLNVHAFERTGQHNERGRVTVGEYLKAVVEHLEHHVRFIDAKRALMGVPRGQQEQTE